MAEATMLAILMQDGCSYSEAKRFVNRHRVTICSENEVDEYLTQVQADKDDEDLFPYISKKDIESGIIMDTSCTKLDGKKYYIFYEN